MENGMCLQGKRAGNSMGRKGNEVDVYAKVGCICKGVRLSVGWGGGRTLLEVGCVKPTEGGN